MMKIYIIWNTLLDKFGLFLHKMCAHTGGQSLVLSFYAEICTKERTDSCCCCCCCLLLCFLHTQQQQPAAKQNKRSLEQKSKSRQSYAFAFVRTKINLLLLSYLLNTSTARIASCLALYTGCHDKAWQPAVPTATWQAPAPATADGITQDCCSDTDTPLHLPADRQATGCFSLC